MYEYRATLEKVVDGDSFDVRIDLGFRITTFQRVRLNGVDTPEVNSADAAERARAKEAKAFVDDWFAGAGTVLVRSHKPGGGDKYGRYLADVLSSPDGHSLAADLIAAGLAKPYDGGAKP